MFSFKREELKATKGVHLPAGWTPLNAQASGDFVIVFAEKWKV
jgi:hypothetical protein